MDHQIVQKMRKEMFQEVFKYGSKINIISVLIAELMIMSILSILIIYIWTCLFTQIKKFNCHLIFLFKYKLSKNSVITMFICKLPQGWCEKC